MLYLFYGFETFLINKEIDKIIKNNKIDNINISKYNLETDSWKDILEDAETISLFATSKIIIVENSYIFTSTIKKTDDTNDIKKLEAYIINPCPSTIMIFKINTLKLDMRKRVVTAIKKKGIIKEFSTIQNINQIVTTLFDDYKIDTSTIKLLISRVGKNLDIISNEIEKIKVYKNTNKIITDFDINNLTNINIEADIFELINCIINNNKKKAINIYNELLLINEEPIKLIITLASKFRLMYQTKQLNQKGYTENDIIKTLQISPAHLNILLKIGNNYESKILLKYLSDLAEMDYKVKSGLIDKYIALELFILAK